MIMLIDKYNDKIITIIVLVTVANVSSHVSKQ